MRESAKERFHFGEEKPLTSDQEMKQNSNPGLSYLATLSVEPHHSLSPTSGSLWKCIWNAPHDTCRIYLFVPEILLS